MSDILKKVKIIVLYNLVKTVAVGMSEDILADEDTVKTAKAIAENLPANHEISLFEIKENNIEDLKKIKPDVFFNNAFGIGSISKSEVDLARILEETGVCFTGSGSKALALTTDKVATKEVVSALGVPVPGNSQTNFPLIVKPASEDCSLGINERAVVNNKQELEKQIKFLEKTYSEAVLVEEYIEGRELNVSVIGAGKNTQVLPISEIIFGPSYKNKPKVVDFAAKWEEQTANFKETVGVCPADLPKAVENHVKEVALKSFLATGCKNITRVDIRLSKDNIPFVLEVNANPGVGPTDGSTRSARAAGYSYSQFLQKIINVALERK